MGTLDHVLTSQHVTLEGFPVPGVVGDCSRAPWEEQGSRGPPGVSGPWGLGATVLWGTEPGALGSCELGGSACPRSQVQPRQLGGGETGRPGQVPDEEHPSKYTGVVKPVPGTLTPQPATPLQHREKITLDPMLPVSLVP